MLEIIDDTFTVQEVHCDGQKVPVQRSCQREILPLCRHLGDIDDLLETNDLYGRDQEQDVNMSAEHGQEEASYHGQRPYRTSDEGLFLLLIFILLGCGLLFRLDSVDFVVSRSYGATSIGHSLVGRGRACPQLANTAIRLMRELDLPSCHFVRCSDELCGG